MASAAARIQADAELAGAAPIGFDHLNQVKINRSVHRSLDGRIAHQWDFGLHPKIGLGPFDLGGVQNQQSVAISCRYGGHAGKLQGLVSHPEVWNLKLRLDAPGLLERPLQPTLELGAELYVFWSNRKIRSEQRSSVDDPSFELCIHLVIVREMNGAIHMGRTTREIRTEAECCEVVGHGHPGRNAGNLLAANHQ